MNAIIVAYLTDVALRPGHVVASLLATLDAARVARHHECYDHTTTNCGKSPNFSGSREL